MGRPSTFTQEVADAICARVAEGEMLRPICREEGMPPWRTVYHWIEDQPQFAEAMERARRFGFDAIAEDTLEIADDARNDWMTKASGGVEFNAEHVQRSKLRIETRLKVLAKWHPKRYGDKIEHTGEITHSYAEVPAVAPSSDEWARQHTPPRLNS